MKLRKKVIKFIVKWYLRHKIVFFFIEHIYSLEKNLFLFFGSPVIPIQVMFIQKR